MARKVTVDFGIPEASKKTRKVTVNFAAPAAEPPAEPTGVYMRRCTHSYLHLRDGHKYGYFLTMDSGTIEVVRVDQVTEVIEEPVKADKKRGIAGSPGKHKTVYRVWLGREEAYDLEPYVYDFKQAVKNYHSSLLARTVAAEREMRRILDLPPLDSSLSDESVIGETPKLGTKPTGAVKGLREPSQERQPKQPKEPKPERVKGYSLAQLCAELKVDPTEARKALRGSKVQKPGGTWEWASKEAAAAARAVIEKMGA